LPKIVTLLFVFSPKLKFLINRFLPPMVKTNRHLFSPTVPTCCVTIDIDTTDYYRDIHGLDRADRSGPPDPAFTIGVRRCLSFFNDLDIPVTLFVIGETLGKVRHQYYVERAHKNGHEIANHTWSHPYNLTDLSPRRQLQELKRADEQIQETIESDDIPRGFRAPGYNVGAETLHICTELGYDYDSSILPSPPYYLAKQLIMLFQEWAGRPSRSATVPIRNAFSPKHPYYVDPSEIWKPVAPEHSQLIEIPMAVTPGLRVPVIGTSLHLLDWLGMTSLAELLIWQFDRILQLEFHAIDFMDQRDLADPELAIHQPDLRISWDTKRDRYSELFDRLDKHYDFRTLTGLVDDL
jgi:hypothetical protein